MIKLFLILFVLSWVLILTLVAGETYAMDHPHSKFTKWWRKHIIGIGW
jgi:hypothetical protein